MIDLQDKSPEELQRLIAEAQVQLEVKQHSMRKDVIAQIKELAASIGVTVDIQDSKKGNKRLSTVEAKYRNPDDHSKTWSGRGLAPKWMQLLLAAGHRKDEFLINT
ncbi:MAG: H-NS histone family protein [Methylococcales bacterium]|nr:H-NS histone family protein [Methylococcales bacterium]